MTASRYRVTTVPAHTYAITLPAIAGTRGAPGSVEEDYADAPSINQDGATIENYPASPNTLYLDGDICCVSSI